MSVSFSFPQGKFFLAWLKYFKLRAVPHYGHASKEIEQSERKKNCPAELRPDWLVVLKYSIVPHLLKKTTKVCYILKLESWLVMKNWIPFVTCYNWINLAGVRPEAYNIKAWKQFSEFLNLNRMQGKFSRYIRLGGSAVR